MKKKIFQWAIVGAGPAGIAAVGKLLDLGVLPADILWVDPAFCVGDLGGLWQNVGSNTKVELFINFLNAISSFAYAKAPIDFRINHLPLNETCLLGEMVQPLQWITEHLKPRVCAKVEMIRTLHLSARVWTLHGDEASYCAKQVILATGAEPTGLHYPDVETISFDVAIDKARLADEIKLDETYAVFGSSHSAIMIIQHLVSLNVKKVINFYRTPCRYAVDMGDWILFDNTGLKGTTAQWARENIDGIWPSNLMRVQSHDSMIQRYLPTCHKVIYATGFAPRTTISVTDYEHTDYNPHVGIIGPGLFGFGIGYPEVKASPMGYIETQVGLWKFMAYLNKVIPIWFNYHT